MPPHKCKFLPAQVVAIRKAAQTTTLSALAEKHGVAHSTIAFMVKGYTYRDVGGPLTLASSA